MQHGSVFYGVVEQLQELMDGRFGNMWAGLWKVRVIIYTGYSITRSYGYSYSWVMQVWMVDNIEVTAPMVKDFLLPGVANCPPHNFAACWTVLAVTEIWKPYIKQQVLPDSCGCEGPFRENLRVSESTYEIGCWGFHSSKKQPVSANKCLRRTWWGGTLFLLQLRAKVWPWLLYSTTFDDQSTVDNRRVFRVLHLQLKRRTKH